MQKDAAQSAGESSHFGRLNAFESSPLGGSVMTFCYRRNLDIKMQQKLCLFQKLSLNTTGGQCKRNIYSKNLFPVLNIIDYSLFFRLFFQH